MMTLLIAIAAFIAGIVIGRIGYNVRLDEERTENVHLGMQICHLQNLVAIWKGKWEIEHTALCESQGRHQEILEENGTITE